MVGRKLSTVLFAGSLIAAAIVGACRDQATTGPSNIPSKDYAANLRVQSGDVQNGAAGLQLPLPLTIKAVDAGGQPVMGASVRWSVIAGGGSVNPPTGVSDVNGIVATTWTLGTGLGVNTVRAYLTAGYVLDSATFSASATAGAPVTITVDAATTPSPGGRVASALGAMSFTVTDQFDHPVPGTTVAFAAGLNSGSLTPATAVSDASGKVSTVWTLGTVTGLQSMTATVGGQLPLTVVESTSPDTSRRIAILSGNSQVIPVGTQAALALTVTVTDRFNNPVPNEPVTFSDSIGSGNVVTPAAGVTDESGIASATLRLGPVAGPQVVRMRTSGSGGQFARFAATSAVAYRDVYAGNFSTCAIATNDRAYCWGFGQDGELGNEALVTRPGASGPVTSTDSIAGPFPTFRDISGGTNHVCGVSLAHTIFCWGFNPDNRAFALPVPERRILAAIDVTTSAASGGANAPFLGSTRVVGAGESFSCAVTLGGIVLCSGNNDLGQLGNGVVGSALQAVQVDTSSAAGLVAPPPPTTYSLIAVGQRHACGMPRFNPTAPIPLVTQTPFCWGQNDNGQLGAGRTFADSASPRMINRASLPVGTVFDSTSLVAGAAHTCVLTSPLPGAAYCWGANSYGQLGKGGPFAVGSRDSVPQLVTGGQTFSRLFAGEYHTCGITAAGQAFCWGRNTSGQLGDGRQTDQSAPVPVGGGLSFRALALGELHSCGITGVPGPSGPTGAFGTVYCWGDNEQGQLGLGVFGANGVPVLTPTRVGAQQQ